jgi:hypothetical protein
VEEVVVVTAAVVAVVAVVVVDVVEIEVEVVVVALVEGVVVVVVDLVQEAKTSDITMRQVRSTQMIPFFIELLFLLSILTSVLAVLQISSSALHKQV